MVEIWKDIEGYEGLYQVSNLGRVMSCDRTVIHARYGTVKRKGKILRQYQDDYGYLRVSLYKNGARKIYTVHRLVLLAFVPNPEKKETVNHIDRNKHNNTVLNLEWNTHAENMAHYHKMRRAI